MAGMQTSCLQRTIDRFREIAVDWRERFTGAREFQERIDEIGHQIHGHSDFLIELLALRWG